MEAWIRCAELSHSALIKRLERARKISLLVRCFGQQVLSDDALTMRLMDRATFQAFSISLYQSIASSDEGNPRLDGRSAIVDDLEILARNPSRMTLGTPCRCENLKTPTVHTCFNASVQFEAFRPGPLRKRPPKARNTRY